MIEDWRNGGFGIYIHWPFCEAKCPYCDFNSHVARFIDHAEWQAAYLEEIEKAAIETHGRVVSSIFFGGGTPSLMEPRVVGAIIDKIQSLWPLANNVEITLEANPSSVEATRFAAFKEAGVNRVSMGTQALNDIDLKRLGRLHTVSEAVAAFDIARNTFDRVSFDLIYGRQDQTLSDWEAELRQALSLSLDHLSLYQLTIEPDTAFGARYDTGKLQGLPDEGLGADMFTLTREVCSDAGMPAYEVSNHAKTDAQSRHNLIYWRYGDYLGIGPGAHGRVTNESGRWATQGPSNPNQWLKGKRSLPRTQLSKSDQAAEFLLMGMRLSEGVEIRRFEHLAGQSLTPYKIDELSALGLISLIDGRIVTTEQGVTVLNGVLRTLLAD